MLLALMVNLVLAVDLSLSVLLVVVVEVVMMTSVIEIVRFAIRIVRFGSIQVVNESNQIGRASCRERVCQYV